MRFIFLGTGASQGVPLIACECEVCKSIDTKDKRLRTSGLLSVEGKNLVIDSGPDFRQQMLSNNISRLDGILFTHEHKDHIAGLDDVRAFNFKQKGDMQVYATIRVQEALKRNFHYAFESNPYPGVPNIQLNTIENAPFLIDNLKVMPIEVLHYKLPVLGFRVNDFTYITDANKISFEEKNKMKKSKVLVLNALRKENHLSHFTLDEAIELVEELKPERCYLTHLSHLIGKHQEVEKELPENVFLAYDGLTIEI